MRAGQEGERIGESVDLRVEGGGCISGGGGGEGGKQLFGLVDGVPDFGS